MGHFGMDLGGTAWTAVDRFFGDFWLHVNEL